MKEMDNVSTDGHQALCVLQECVLQEFEDAWQIDERAQKSSTR